MKKLLYIFIFQSFLILSVYASTLNLSMSSSPSRLTPFLANDTASSEISDWIFNGLFKYDKDGNIDLDLAKSYTFKDKTHLIIQLKKNVRWHDGKPFTADDVLFTYNTIINPKVFTSILSNYKEVKSVKKLDDYTIEVIYKKPYFKALETWLVGIIPKHLLKDEKDLMTSSFNKKPIGTGPYKLKLFETGQDITLQANDDYFEGRPNIDELHYRFLPDPSTSFLMLKQNLLDLGSLRPLQLDRQINEQFKRDYTIIEKPRFAYDYVAFNLRRKKFQDIRIRQALSLGIDRQELVDILFFGHGRVATGPFLPGSFAFNSSVEIPKPNIKQAKALLKEAGFDENNSFEFEVVTNTGTETRINAAQILQYQLAKVGVKMNIRVMEWQAYLNTVVHPRNFDAILMGWSMPLMPDAYPLWHTNSDKLGGFNLTGYSNKKVDKLIEEGSTTIQKEKLAMIYQEIYKTIANDLPYLFLYIPNSITVVNSKIKNIEPAFTGVKHNQIDWIKE